MSLKKYVYTPPAVVKKDKPAIDTRAILFPFRDATTTDSKIEKRKISLNFMKKGHEKIPQISGETLAKNWGAFLEKTGTFKGIGFAFGDDQSRNGRVGIGGSIIQAQYLIEDPVCLLRIRVLFEARRPNEEKPFWREDLFESGKCHVDPKDARKQYKALNTMFDALFTKALKSLEVGLEKANIAGDAEEMSEGVPAAEDKDAKKSPTKKAVANDSVIDELYRRALGAQ